MIAKLIYKDNMTFIEVNGESFSPVAYMTYCPDKQRFAEFTDIGVAFYSFTVHIGDQGINEESGVHPFSQHVYVAENQYDFTAVDKTLNMISQYGKNTFIFPRVYIDAPIWWEKKHSSELCCDYRGDTLKQSFASQKWREDMWVAFKALIDHINESVWKESVIGYHIAFGGTEECVYQVQSGHSVDYSEVNRKAYCKWLRNKYNSLDDLNKRWNSSYKAYDEITVPKWIEREYCKNGVLRSLSEERHVIDYYEYANNLIANTVLYFCEKVKKYTNNNVLTGAFYGYIWMIYNQDKGTHNLITLLESPYIDFVASTNGGAGPKGSWPFGSAADSVLLHKKLWFAEGDIRTYKSTLLKDTLPHVVPDNHWYDGPAWIGPATMELSISSLKKAGARVLTGHTGIWWFDMFGNWFRTPEMMSVISNHRKWMNEQTYGPLQAEIAVIIDETGYKYYGLKQPVLNDVIGVQKNELAWMGAPYHVYLADDLANPDFQPDRYKLYVFLTCIYPSDKVKEAIELRIKNNGRTLLWVYLEDLNHDNCNKSVTDFDVKYTASSEKKQCMFGNVLFPKYPVQCARFLDSDIDQSYKIASFNGSDEPCILWRETDSYSSVYCLLPAIPAALLNRIAALSKVHIYNQTGDVIFAGGRFVGIHATTAGDKRIYFPLNVDKVVDAETNAEMRINYNFIDFEMLEFETRVFKLIVM